MTPMRLRFGISAVCYFLMHGFVLSDETANDESIALTGAQAAVSNQFPNEYVDEVQAVLDPELSKSLGRWPNFASYIKAGPSFSLGDGFFGDDGRVGFALIGGVREHLFPNSGPWFLDFGGAFVTNGGRDETRTISGVEFQGNNLPPLQTPNAFESTLRELRRASLHTAIGFYYQPIKEVNYDLLFSLRFGGRLGHAKGVFDRVRLDSTGPNVVPNKEFADNDTFYGLFVGLESVLARQEFFGGDLNLIIDAEVANDWIELGSLKKAGLPTASVLFGLTLRR